MELELEPEPPQSKRKRRPSVRLGEIGEIGFSSLLWLEPAPRQRRKQATTTTSNGAVKQRQPRIRPLEHVAGENKNPALVEEEWSVVEPVVASEKLAVAEGTRPASTPRQGKQRSRVFTPKTNNKEPSLRWTGSKVRGRQADHAARLEPLVENRAHDEKDRHESPFRASTSSDSEELTGRGLKHEALNGASEGSEGGDPGANPNSHGDEMQGAIEDGPGQANGKGFRTERVGQRRSGRQVAARRNDNGTPSRDTVFASRETTAEEPRDAAPAVATTATPSSSHQRLLMLSAGVSGWLRELGLGKYSELFELNEVDTEVLPLLTMDDLREMGVDAVGARRKMFSNIQELGQELRVEFS